ncbi:MAG: hypothetical protein WBD55_10620 [Dehalococcoidia bacterium]
MRPPLRALPWWSGFLFALLAGALTLGIGCGGGDEEALPTPTAPTPTTQASASPLLEQLIDAINGGDVTAAMALFSDDAVSEGGPFCYITPCADKAAIQTDIEFYIQEHLSFSACSAEGSGNMANARCEVRTDGTREAGIDRFIATPTVEMEGGKLSAFRWGALDISDQQTATYWAPRGPALYQEYIDSINRGDVAAAMALFADDAIFEVEPACSPALCTGKEAIQQEVEREVADKVSLTSTKAELFDLHYLDGVAGFRNTKITDVLEIRASPGADQPTSASITLELVGGKIVSLRLEAASTN